jgi:HD-like signal output (HDOD) protein
VNGNRQSTKDLILAGLQEHSDFPAMSNTINIINQFETTEDTSVSEFANIVLKDYALTSKVLKLVNSVSYSQFGEVTTISRAIILLGFENIKNLALTLMLFDHFKKNSSNVEHIDIMVKSFYSGVLAQKICGEIYFVNKEEAFICSLFHSFGKMLVSFALPAKIEEIKFVSREKNISEEAAALEVLGGRYEEVGMAIARGWHFPNKIIHSMHKLRGMEITASASEIDKLNSIASFANEIANILSNSSEKKEMDEKIGKLVEMFKTHFGELDSNIMAGIINASFEDLNQFSSIFNINLETVPFNRQLLTWADKAGTSAVTPSETVLTDYTIEELKTIDIIFESEKENTPESIFAKGIQDINSSILSNFSLNDIIRIVLETMYRGMQLSGESKALFLIKDTKLPVMNTRFGFGSGIEELKKWFNITLDDSGDIFNRAIVKQNDLVIKDIEPPDVKKLLPKWFKSKVFAKIFIVLLPIIINNKPIGMFYVEGDREGFQKISAGHLNYLKILRDQTVVAIRQKQWS